MKKIFSFFAAILFAGSLMAESITITPSEFKSAYGDGGTFTLSEVGFEYTGVMYNGKNSPTGFASKQLIQCRKSSSGAGEIKNSDALNMKSIIVATQNDKDFTLSVGAAADELAAVDKPAGVAGKYACKDNLDGDKEADVTVYTFDVSGKKFFQFLNGAAASYIAYITIELESGEGGGGGGEEAKSQTLYLQLSSDWASYPAKYAIYYFDDETNGWSDFMSAVEDEDNMYSAAIPEGYAKVIFVRLNGEASVADWASKWSQTVNLDLDGVNDLFTVTSGGTGDECDGDWSKYEKYVRILEDGFYLIGPDWDEAALDAKNYFEIHSGDEYVLKGVTLAKDQQIKVAKVVKDKIVAFYPDGMGTEYTVDEKHAGTGKDIYFQEAYKSDWADFGGYFWTGETAPVDPIVPGEDITITAADFKSAYGDGGTFTISEVNFAYSGVMYNGKNSPTGFAAKQLIQCRKSSSGAGEIKNSDALNMKSIIVATQNDKDFTLSVGAAADELAAVDKPAGVAGKYACKDNLDGDKEADVTVYTFDVAGKKFFQFLNGAAASYIAYIKIELASETPDPEPKTRTLYLDAADWNVSDPAFFIHSWGGASDKDVQMEVVSGNVFKAEIPEDNGNVIFVRMATGSTSISWTKADDQLWNKTDDLVIPDDKDLYQITAWGDAGTGISEGKWLLSSDILTAIDNTAIEVKAIKSIENGMLIIEKAGVRYNVMGQIVR